MDLDGTSGPTWPTGPTWGSVPVGEVEPTPPEPTRKKGVWIAAGVALVVVAGAIIAVAVTSSSSTPSPAVVLSRASKRTTGSGTAHIEASVHLSESGHSITPLVLSGDTDFGAHSSQITMSSQGREIAELRAVNGTTYIESALAHLPGGKSWVSISSAEMGVDKTAKAFQSQADPTQGLQYLGSFKGTPTVAGHESIAGANTTHYKFTIDLNSLVDTEAKVGKKLNAPGVGEGFAALKAAGVDLAHIPAEAWIDNAGRVRKFSFTFTLTAEGETASVTDDLSFSDFNAPVTIEAPPSSDVEPFRNVPDYFSRLSQSESTS